MKKIFILISLVVPSFLQAHQPVMDMAPRWMGGFGAQLRVAHQVEDKLERTGNSVSNPNNLKREKTTTWYEGVYTYRRGLRFTVKVPYIDKNEKVMKDGLVQNLSASGFGDVILGLPLKYYFNRAGYTGNWSLTPSLFLPTGPESSELPLGRGDAGYGLSLSFSFEAFQIYTLFDLFTKPNDRTKSGGDLGRTLGIDWDVGIHPYHNNQTNSGIFLMAGLNGRKKEKNKLINGQNDPNSGGETFEVAPTVVLYKQNWMWRTQYHIPIYQKLNGTQLSKSYEIQSGIGVTF